VGLVKVFLLSDLGRGSLFFVGSWLDIRMLVCILYQVEVAVR